MNLTPGAQSFRRLLLLAPGGAKLTQFADVCGDWNLHERLLAQLQRFRGRVYLAEQNLTRSDLLPDGRHVQPADFRSWHLFSLTPSGEVVSCARICVYPEAVGYSDLMVSHSALARSPVWGNQVREAVEGELSNARRRGLRFAEVGGWAIDRLVRCTTEATRMLVAGYALADMIGSGLAISTVNLCHNSASILRRMGGRPLVAGETELPPYYEPQYSAELEVLRFDSARLSPRYASRIQACRAALRGVKVVCSEPGADSRESSLEQLQVWLNGAQAEGAVPFGGWDNVPRHAPA